MLATSTDEGVVRRAGAWFGRAWRTVADALDSLARKPAAPFILILLFVATLLAFGQVARVGPDGFNVARFEFAGDAARAERLLPEAHIGAVRSSILWDFPFIALYMALFAWTGIYGSKIIRTRFAQRAVGLAGIAGVVAGLCDVAENVCFWRLLHKDAAGAFDRLDEARYMTAATIPKWTLAIFATFIGVIVLWTTIARLARGRRKLPQFQAPPESPPLYDEGHPWCWPSGQTRYGWNHTAYPVEDAPAKPVGVCFSGGGIRSASFSLGALQVLGETEVPGSRTKVRPSILSRADYLSTVSGGGYLGVAAQILAHQGVTDPYASGSPEEDHMRRHGRYLADSAGEWASAVARLVAGLSLNLLVFLLLLFAFGRPIGWAQRDVLFDKNQVKPSVAQAQASTAKANPARAPKGSDGERDEKKPLRGLKTTNAMWFAAAWPAALALLILLAGTILGGIDSSWRDGLLAAAGGLAALALVVLGVVWLLPTVARLTPDVVGWIGRHLPGKSDQGTAGNATIFTALTVGASGTLISVLRTPAPQASSTAKKRFDWRKYLGLVGRAAPYITGALLAVAALAVFALIVSGGAAPGGFEWPFGRSDGEVYLGAAVVLLLLYAGADQTRWSLHPLYRRRLASAFAVSRTPDGRAGELPWSEPTTLSEYGKRAKGIPQLLVCAAANVEGQDIAPAGRRAVSFVFTDRYVGGPQVGWARTRDFEDALGGVQRHDATILGAMAISGAAFASAMGRHSKGSLNSLLAVTNARLGVWMPNPRYIAELRGVEKPDAADGWPGPWVRRRRFTYLLKEIGGMYSSQDRYLYLTDGGHYENLGLVELMRRRCRTMLCFDAAGDSLETCGTFVEALMLAREELGITTEITLEPLAPLPKRGEPVTITVAPGTEPPDVGVIRLLAGRLSEDCVVSGTVTYLDPDTGRPDPVPAKLVLAKAALTKHTPLEVLNHAARESKPRFPNDPTGDQWFDGEQFNSYHLLGEDVARRACKHLTAADF